jgi:hypothetical protein
MKQIIFLFFIFGTLASFAGENPGLPLCQAELRNDMNTTIAKTNWNQDFYMGHLEGATNAVLITTSLGNDQIMSLWVREKRQANQAGMFSFVDLSSGREQYMRFYMADGYSVLVNCKWQQ